MSVQVFEEKTKKNAYNKQTQAVKGKNKSNCPLSAVGENANKARIYDLTRWTPTTLPRGARDADSSSKNCEMLCVTQNRAKGNR